MTLGMAQRQGNLLDDVNRFCEQTLGRDSVYAFLHRERDNLFPDEMFEDLFSTQGRRSVPPSVVATVMVLQRLEGLSDREAVERYTFDTRWRYAAGVGGYDTGGWEGFAHTVLVDMRERLRCSDHPDRIFDVGLSAAKAAGLLGRRRVLDSTPLYDAVATMDTVTLVRSALRGLLGVADAELEAKLRAGLKSGDDYATSAKPQIDWDDPTCREQLIDSRAKDAHVCLALLDGEELDLEVAKAAKLLATVVGQDIEEGDDGVFRIVRKVVPDRVISTVDTDTRRGHKTTAHSFEGYKGHAAIDPDSEIITGTSVTPGNHGDASVAPDLIEDLLADSPEDGKVEQPDRDGKGEESDGDDKGLKVYGDSAYGTGEFLAKLEERNIVPMCKTQPPHAAGGLFTKDLFDINLAAKTGTCPAGVTVPISPHGKRGGIALFGKACGSCKIRSQCTTSTAGRSIRVGRFEEHLARARQTQVQPEWKADYRATRPKIERKLAHLMRRRHGGRRARVRGTAKIQADFKLLAAATNLARLAVLGVQRTSSAWAIAG